ncbi:NADH-ubiquinone oxidoreductase B12 subunit family protein [Medicago truncatula]|uniref:NADH-ubiquinone oxidoreductase B12 subunit family protein n=1 Tax=Medicago truncatula TaxID=3880 RepID=A0A072V3K3_MEDTR|nr:NADH-ubiquinone oxidoreductase B12 subunit family protein [Medicago truncatula]
MGAGKNTAEFFKRRDEWRKHPMLGNQMRHATPGLGIALVAFGVYLVAEQVYNKINSSSHSHHHVCEGWGPLSQDHHQSIVSLVQPE